MKMFIPLICLLSAALAEPPVDGYASARAHYHSHDHDDSNSFQRSLSQQYGTPEFGARNTPSTEYGPPNAKTASSRSNPVASYLPPSSRNGLSQEYGVPSTRIQMSSSRSLSTEYGLPDSRSTPSAQYGVPTARSGPSQEYGVPSSFGRRLSTQFGAPASRSALSQEYGVPSRRIGSTGKSFASSSHARKSQKSQFGSRSLSTNYGAPSVGNFGSYARQTEALSQTYGAPSQRIVSDTYGVPIARDLSQEYGAPSNHNDNQESDVVIAARSSPSDTYGVPLTRNLKPSEQYGVPDLYSNNDRQGYPNARNALNELLNQEPANYEYAYKVDDLESGSDFGHTEEREGDKATGTYFVVLPDGTKQIVEYEADEHGFKPRISVEPVDLGRSGGYDDNASDLTSAVARTGGYTNHKDDLVRSGDGPY